jgi:hypothetical protein
LDPGQSGHDPYWLPDAWVDISVAPEVGNFAVTLRAKGIHENLRVLARAEAFAKVHAIGGASTME